LAIRYYRKPPRMFLQNNGSVLKNHVVTQVRDIINEYLDAGFIGRAKEMPYCILPLQLKESATKVSLIYDMSPLNEYVEKSKFKLEGWEEMFHYSANSSWAIKFDLKKFYYNIDVNTAFKTYFGFMYQMKNGEPPTTFIWNTLPYGYTRAPFIARQLLKPLIAKWRKYGINIVVFYDDGMAVSHDKMLLQKMSILIHCDLVNAGLVPGIGKCNWEPVQIVDWNGLTFNFIDRGISIMKRRIESTQENLTTVLEKWPNVTYREVSKTVGQIMSMHPVFDGTEQIKTRMLQTFVNIRHYRNESWDSLISADYKPLYQFAKDEITDWQQRLVARNFRLFEKPVPNAVAWVDASDFAIGGLLAKISNTLRSPVTVDNWLLTDYGAYRRVNNRAKMQVDLIPWSTQYTVRDEFDMDPQKIEKLCVVHRNLTYAERVVDSNERELLAAVQLLKSCRGALKNSNITLHFDNLNASIICKKGSPKPRLQKYAVEILEICEKLNCKLNPVWIPRDLNNVADIISKTMDYDDYAVKNEFFLHVQRECEKKFVTDCFANTENAKTRRFFSLSYCPKTAGVDAFAYNWKLSGFCWVFPPPRMVGQVLTHAKNCGAEMVILVPQWKNSYFYTLLLHIDEKYVKKVMIFDGSGIFLDGADKSSYFGSNFRGFVECWWLNFY
jgi:hypothetical protein